MPYKVRPSIYEFRHGSKVYRAGEVVPDDDPAVKAHIGKFIVVPEHEAGETSEATGGAEGDGGGAPEDAGRSPSSLPVAGREFSDDQVSDRTLGA